MIKKNIIHLREKCFEQKRAKVYCQQKFVMGFSVKRNENDWNRKYWLSVGSAKNQSTLLFL